MNPSQVAWFRQENTRIPAADTSKGKGILFFHIPMPEHVTLYNEYPFYGSKLSNISPWAVNTGLYAAIVE